MSRLMPLLLIILLPLLNACGKMMGLKKLKPLPETAISETAAACIIPAADSYVLDSSSLRILKELYAGKPTALKDHLQPLQAIYYSVKNSFQFPDSWQINCYAGGFPDLKWNREGRMEQFPPALQAPLDSLLSLKKRMEFLRPVTGAMPFNSISFDYIVLVYWNRFMGRQSKNLIKAVQQNVTLAGDKRVKIIYVNNDNLFSQLSR